MTEFAETWPLPALLAAAAAGALLGVVFFGGLWATLRRLRELQHPALWMLASLMLRFAILLSGFYLIAVNGGWQHLLAATVGFTLMRWLAVSRLRVARHREESRT